MTNYLGYTIIRDQAGRYDIRYEAYKDGAMCFVASSKENLYTQIDLQVKRDRVERGIYDVSQGRPYIPDIYKNNVLDLEQARLNKASAKPKISVTFTESGITINNLKEIDKNDD